MQYDELFEKPIVEYSDEEIIARAIQLREVAKTTKITKAVEKQTVKRKTKKEKEQEALAALLDKANAVAAGKEGK
jgi:hypothetical protein